MKKNDHCLLNLNFSDFRFMFGGVKMTIFLFVLISFENFDGSAVFAQIPNASPPLVVNEVSVPNPQNTVVSKIASVPWIEFYNPSYDPFNSTGWMLIVNNLSFNLSGVLGVMTPKSHGTVFFNPSGTEINDFNIVIPKGQVTLSFSIQGPYNIINSSLPNGTIVQTKTRIISNYTYNFTNEYAFISETLSKGFNPSGVGIPDAVQVFATPNIDNHDALAIISPNTDMTFTFTEGTPFYAIIDPCVVSDLSIYSLIFNIDASVFYPFTWSIIGGNGPIIFDSTSLLTIYSENPMTSYPFVSIGTNICPYWSSAIENGEKIWLLIRFEFLTNINEDYQTETNFGTNNPLFSSGLVTFSYVVESDIGAPIIPLNYEVPLDFLSEIDQLQYGRGGGSVPFFSSSLILYVPMIPENSPDVVQLSLNLGGHILNSPYNISITASTTWNRCPFNYGLASVKTNNNNTNQSTITSTPPSANQGFKSGSSLLFLISPCLIRADTDNYVTIVLDAIANMTQIEEIIKNNGNDVESSTGSDGFNDGENQNSNGFNGEMDENQYFHEYLQLSTSLVSPFNALQPSQSILNFNLTNINNSNVNRNGMTLIGGNQSNDAFKDLEFFIYQDTLDNTSHPLQFELINYPTTDLGNTNAIFANICDRYGGSISLTAANRIAVTFDHHQLQSGAFFVNVVHSPLIEVEIGIVSNISISTSPTNIVTGICQQILTANVNTNNTMPFLSQCASSLPWNIISVSTMYTNPSFYQSFANLTALFNELNQFNIGENNQSTCISATKSFICNTLYPQCDVNGFAIQTCRSQCEAMVANCSLPSNLNLNCNLFPETNCNPGFVANSDISISTTSTSSCRSGWIQNLATTSSATGNITNSTSISTNSNCVPCPIGSYWLPINNSNPICTPCLNGYFSLYDGSIACFSTGTTTTTSSTSSNQAIIATRWMPQPLIPNLPAIVPKMNNVIPNANQCNFGKFVYDSSVIFGAANANALLTNLNGTTTMKMINKNDYSNLMKMQTICSNEAGVDMVNWANCIAMAESNYVETSMMTSSVMLCTSC